jgi:hypothetical protein
VLRPDPDGLARITARRLGEGVRRSWVVPTADAIQKSDLRGRVSFAKAVDLVLRQDPQLYEAYRKS